MLYENNMKTLSDKIVRNAHCKVNDIKEFVKELKEDIEYAQKDCATLDVVDKDKIIKLIDKKAGDKLT